MQDFKAQVERIIKEGQSRRPMLDIDRNSWSAFVDRLVKMDGCKVTLAVAMAIRDAATIPNGATIRKIEDLAKAETGFSVFVIGLIANYPVQNK